MVSEGPGCSAVLGFVTFTCESGIFSGLCLSGRVCIYCTSSSTSSLTLSPLSFHDPGVNFPEAPHPPGLSEWPSPPSRVQARTLGLARPVPGGASSLPVLALTPRIFGVQYCLAFEEGFLDRSARTCLESCKKF